ncbi:glycosyltransferase [Fictibacillus barbaricus]|uniref:Glycosyltransferase involved in cell wall biosynthesis n=1 Tax=Fictibacillus barbaricus TaxID=182136 RepID=A0ABU1U1F5_9BACL|nr:glycosyltransferase [Fictibacillus barbaricus]MDR7073322.1 glycosyltransferase involved in cell wall biosynthesis [Fictibacillus barbaricus]
MKTILLISDGKKIGGAEKYLVGVINLLKSKYRFNILMNDEIQSDFSGDKEINTICKVISNKKPLSTILNFLKVYLKIRPDIIHLNLTHPTSCLWIQILSLFFPKGKFKATLHLATSVKHIRIYKYILKRTYKKMEVILVAESAISKLKNNYGIHTDMEVIPNWIDNNHFSIPSITFKAKLRKQLLLPEDKKIGLFIGRFEEQKNLLKLLELTKKYLSDEWLLLLVGEGSMIDQIKTYIKQHNMSNYVRLYPFTNDPRNYYWVADSFFLISKYECTPLSLLEAMSTGLASVVTDVGDMKLMVGKEEFVIKYNEHSDNSLDCLKSSLKEDPNYWRNQVVNNYSPITAYEKLVSIYK